MLMDKLIRQVENLELDLRGKTVLTEAASGAYIVTPVLAALAGATVYAFTRKSRYGTVEEIFENTKRLAAEYDGLALDIRYVEKLEPRMVAAADVITNLGHLRPLTEEILAPARDALVIPLMYEAWEWRDADMDIAYIRKRKFRLGATNERHPSVDVFNYLGDMALKQIFDAGICPYNNKFVLICNNDFGPFIAKVLSKVCAGLAVIDKNENLEKYESDKIRWIGGFPDIRIPADYRDAEAVVFTAYPFDECWIGQNGPLSLEQLGSQLKNPYILRYCGDVDEEGLKKASVRFYPEHVHSGHMGILPSAIGNDPIIRLQSGGLKAAELMMKNETHYKNIPLVEHVA